MLRLCQETAGTADVQYATAVQALFTTIVANAGALGGGAADVLTANGSVAVTLRSACKPHVAVASAIALSSNLTPAICSPRRRRRLPPARAKRPPPRRLRGALPRDVTVLLLFSLINHPSLHLKRESTRSSGSRSRHSAQCALPSVAGCWIQDSGLWIPWRLVAVF